MDDNCEISFQSDLETSIYRLLLLSYIPTGFWSRLITRLLAEDSIVDTLRVYFNVPRHVRLSLSPLINESSVMVDFNRSMLILLKASSGKLNGVAGRRESNCTTWEGSYSVSKRWLIALASVPLITALLGKYARETPPRQRY